MANYIILTHEGTTYDPTMSEVNNLQVLDVSIEATSKEDAIELTLRDNKWILDSGFKAENFIVYELAE